eukprot:scaffold1947_cov207-Prasinococcus_capsulatus_cf.AAC.33
MKTRLRAQVTYQIGFRAIVHQVALLLRYLILVVLNHYCSHALRERLHFSCFPLLRHPWGRVQWVPAHR